jgi:hypothetical protein
LVKVNPSNANGPTAEDNNEVRAHMAWLIPALEFNLLRIGEIQLCIAEFNNPILASLKS